ncbi:hypothetical protein [Streptomyces sp. NPDC047108]|uniref:hypothetical protein n=1 Tax=Streptomyces sp. NPDC047108 TaxID=3155025 RepID=UPI0034012771
MVEAGVDISGSQTTAQHHPSPDFSRASDDAGDGCDLVTVPARQGLEAVDILRRAVGPGVPPGCADAEAAAVGPVLLDGGGDTLGFLVPPGTADAWDVPGSACTQTAGRGLPLVTEESEGEGWLVPPAGDNAVTDPEVLRAALGEAARLIEAADGCS